MNLSEKLAFLTRPDPKIKEIDDDDDDTIAKLAEKSGIDESVDVHTTKLRRQSQGVLNEDDDDNFRYAGTPVSRKNLMGHEGSNSDSEDLKDEDSGDSEMSATDSDDSQEGSEQDSNSNPQGSVSTGINEQDSAEESEGEEAALEEFKQKMTSKHMGGNESFSFTDDGDYSKYADDSGDDDDEDEDDESGSENDDENESSDESMDENQSFNETETSVTKEEGGVQSFSKTNVEDELNRGKATKAQLGLWDSLLEIRIKMQKSVVAANQLPQPDSAGLFVKQGGEQYKEAQKLCTDSVKQLLDQLVQLQTLLLLQFPETKQIVKADSGAVPTNGEVTPSNDDDEEITSEEEEGRVEDTVHHQQQQQNLKRKLPNGEIPELLAKRHKTFQVYRDKTIQKWYDKTRVASGKLGKGFSAFESSTVKQIQQVLSDKDRLIKRTQLKRSIYRVLGKKEDSDTPQKKNTESDDDDEEKSGLLRKNHLKDYDPEIFDDDDFYHQLLRQLIERKTTDVNDPIALSRHWLQVQKLRSKVKRKVDTRASKGRKLRYDVHAKLANFMAPFDTCKWTDQARNDLYSSLFGQRTNRNNEPAER